MDPEFLLSNVRETSETTDTELFKAYSSTDNSVDTRDFFY